MALRLPSLDSRDSLPSVGRLALHGYTVDVWSSVKTSCPVHYNCCENLPEYPRLSDHLPPNPSRDLGTNNLQATKTSCHGSDRRFDLTVTSAVKFHGTGPHLIHTLVFQPRSHSQVKQVIDDKSPTRTGDLTRPVLHLIQLLRGKRLLFV